MSIETSSEDALSLESLEIGAHPLVEPLLERLRVRELLSEALPVPDPRAKLAPIEAALDLGLERVGGAVGSAARDAFVKGDTTRWGSDPWTMGSYPSVEPGKAGMMATLRKPVADRIFFAGDACHEDLPGSCAGAHYSGIETAEAVIHCLL